jgi:hypothetical protein
LKNKGDIFVHRKIFTAIGLNLVLTSAVVTNDVHNVQAQPLKVQNCNPICSNRSPRGHTGSPRRELIEQIEALIKQQRATAGDYRKLADAYKQEGNYDLARLRLSQGLEVAKKNGDAEGQAIIMQRQRELIIPQRQIAPSQIQVNPSRLQIRQ